MTETVDREHTWHSPPSSADAPAGPGPDAAERRFRLGVAAITLAAGVFLALRLTAWPPHEDETLALFIGRNPLDRLFSVVLEERGGAPLHFLVAWAVAHVGGGLEALRGASALFAVASLPLVAALGRRLADRRTALVATALVAASWMLLFHGVYARMYSLFLCTSLLSYLALLVAVERGGRRRWAVWVGAVLLTVATHPYGALVFASQVVYAAIAGGRERRAALTAAGAVAFLGIPFWLTDLRLAGRFDVTVGGGTYYAFQPGAPTGLEYAAELATRYHDEQLAMIQGRALAKPAFKCGPIENANAWNLLVDEFFGGVDFVPRCP